MEVTQAVFKFYRYKICKKSGLTYTNLEDTMYLDITNLIEFTA